MTSQNELTITKLFNFMSLFIQFVIFVVVENIGIGDHINRLLISSLITFISLMFIPLQGGFGKVTFHGFEIGR